MRRARRHSIDGGGNLGKLISVAAINLRRKPDSTTTWRGSASRAAARLLINAIHDLDCLRALAGEIESVNGVQRQSRARVQRRDARRSRSDSRTGALGNLTLSDAVQAPWAWEVTSGEEGEYPREHEDATCWRDMDGSLSIPTLTHVRNERQGGRADPFIRKELF
jgi:predicted dehydrogenase